MGLGTVYNVLLRDLLDIDSFTYLNSAKISIIILVVVLIYFVYLLVKNGRTNQSESEVKIQLRGNKQDVVEAPENNELN